MHFVWFGNQKMAQLSHFLESKKYFVLSIPIKEMIFCVFPLPFGEGLGVGHFLFQFARFYF